MIDLQSTANETPEQDFEIFRGAPRPIIFEVESGGLLRSFDDTLRMTVTVRGQPAFTLGVGNGISLETSQGVPQARAIVQLTRAQSRLIPLGWYAAYEIQEGTAENEKGVLTGRLKGKGGANVDI
jgi:hypothetical protein